MPKILLFGSQGQLGWELERTLAPLGSLSACDFPQVDFTRLDHLRNLIRDSRPTIIINASAYTEVDRAEMEHGIADMVNSQAPGVLAEMANEMDASLIHFSTDYVFDGKKGSAYSEADPPNPLNVYGKSKLGGEQSVATTGNSFLIFRTSWVYSLRRESFVTKVLNIAQTKDKLSIVTDQVGSPTWARMLAEITALILAQASASKNPVHWIYERKGLYHLAGDGQASRYEWAQSILDHEYNREATGKPVLIPARSADFPTPAKRPLFSALDCAKFKNTFALALPPWKSALSMAMDDGSV